MGTQDNTAELLHKLQNELTRKRVLLVDRHPNARDSLRLMLSNMGINLVHGAGNSAEVLRQVKANSFDIILSDYLLDDGRDGQQLLEELRQQHLIQLTTVFMIVTGERGYRNVISVAELAPDDYLIKPFTAEQLQGRLARALYKKHCFSAVYRHLDDGAFIAALNACDRLLANDSPFDLDTLRLKGEILNALGRNDEAEEVYRLVLQRKVLPWAKMGLAVALRGQNQLEDAESLVELIVKDFPDYLAAYDYLAGIREEMGKLPEAQEVLQQAAAISPNNSLRQRLVGDVAVRNHDLDAAERAYGKVLERHRGSSLRSVDDYTNLSRVMLDRGHVAGARSVTQELRRDWRGDKHGELAALVMDSLVCDQEGEPAKAKQALEKALALHQAIGAESGATRPLSQKIAIDLAHACLANGEDGTAQEILRKVAAENNENRNMLAQIQGVFAKTGNEEAGNELLAQVAKEIVELNNRGVLAARGGDFEGSVELLIQAAERVPNVQFLVNASKAIFTLLERKGWNEAMAERGVLYLQQAQAKEARSSRVISARELYQRVATKYGIAVAPLSATRAEAEKK